MPSIIFHSQSCNRSLFVTKILSRFKAEIKGKILIKVNLVSYEPYPTTTHPELLKAVLKNLAGHDVIVGDAPAVDLRSFDIKDTIIFKLCQKLEIPFVNFYDEAMQTSTTPQGQELTFSTYPLNYDYIISLPVLKNHPECSLTGALKNAFGYFTKKDRIYLHMGKKKIHQAIAELNAIVKPNLTIMDAIETLIKANEIRHGGIQRHLGYLLAGEDPVALDALGFSLLKQLAPDWPYSSPSDIKHLKQAIDLGIGSPDYQLSEI
ncbi:MAG: DUF362 domain-containing protein [Candidatus Helarchaeota archaeon]